MDRTTIEKLRIAIFTFNTGSEIFEQRAVKDYVAHMIKINGNNIPDIISINLQESSYGNPAKAFGTDRLIQYFLEEIKKKDPTVLLFEDKLIRYNSGGIIAIKTGVILNRNNSYIIDFIKYDPLHESILSVSDGQHFGKGSLIVQLTINKQDNVYRVIIVNSHLPFISSEIGQGKDERDQTIIETLAFLNKNTKDKDASNITRFIVGDLNYRVDFGMNKKKQEQYLELINKNATINGVRKYKKYDQMGLTMDSILMDYREGVDYEGTSFLPTYKFYKSDIDNFRIYQTIKNDQPRIPSWCDRILYSGDVTCLAYESFDNEYTKKSDHRPVLGLYEISEEGSHKLSEYPYSFVDVSKFSKINKSKDSIKGIITENNITNVNKIRRHSIVLHVLKEEDINANNHVYRRKYSMPAIEPEEPEEPEEILLRPSRKFVRRKSHSSEGMYNIITDVGSKIKNIFKGSHEKNIIKPIPNIHVNSEPIINIEDDLTGNNSGN
jgi:hypothetical protein